MPSGAGELGVLALQGDFREHRAALERLGVPSREVRLPADLQGLRGLILPGGESTTMVRLMEDFGLADPLRAFAESGGALWGTCAGAILLAKSVEGREQRSLGLMGIAAVRNAYGRQIDSFETPLQVTGLADPFPGIFIRSPKLRPLPGAQKLEVLAWLEREPVLIQQGNRLASSFHPELSADLRLHRYFASLAGLPV